MNDEPEDELSEEEFRALEAEADRFEASLTPEERARFERGTNGENKLVFWLVLTAFAILVVVGSYFVGRMP